MRADALRGTCWFNALSEQQRLHWLLRAGSDVPADAWSVFKAGLPHTQISPNAAPAVPNTTRAAHHDQYRVLTMTTRKVTPNRSANPSADADTPRPPDNFEPCRGS